MILEYHRPEKIEDALALLARVTPVTVPLGGGTVLNAPGERSYAVVDLQALGLSAIERKGTQLKIGATATLQALLDTQDLPTALADAIMHEATYNLRQTGTIAGTLVSAGGRSPFLTAMLALDAQLTWLPGDLNQALGEFVPLRKSAWPGAMISEVGLSTQPSLAYQYVARSPADRPVVCAAAARWPSGRTRVVLGGYGAAPMAVLDGEVNEEALAAVGNAYLTAGDAWASAEYRADSAKTLAKRCLLAVGAIEN